MHGNVYYRNAENVRYFVPDLWQAIRNYCHDKSGIQKTTIPL